MTDTDHKRWSEDLAAYVLGALEADEAAALERHMEGCERCREEMRWLQPAAPHAAGVGRAPGAAEAAAAEPDGRGAGRRSGGARSPVPSRWRSLRGDARLRVATGFAVVALVAAAVVGYEVGDGGSGEAAAARSSPASRRDHGEDGERRRRRQAAPLRRRAAALRQGSRGLGGTRRQGGSGAGPLRPRPQRSGRNDDRGHERRQDGDGHQGAERRQRNADRRADRDAVVPQ